VATSFRADVQGLRGVAVLSVLLAHARVPGVAGGFVGVDVFFVLSGFLITGLLLAEQERTGRVSLGAFYVRRGRRILPAATVVLLTTGLASALLLDVVRAAEVARDAVWAALFAANWRFASAGTDYFSRDLPPSPVQHFWSLGVEEQFYLLWPVLLALLAARGRRLLAAGLAALCAISFACSVVQTSSAPHLAYFSSLTRAWELAVGAGVAVAASQLLRLPRPVAAAASWLGLAGVVAAVVRYDGGTALPGTAAVLPVLSTALLLACGARSRFGADLLLSRQPLRYVGDVSYSLYLWHWPFLVVAAGHLGRDLRLGESLLVLGGALLAAVLSFHLVENPFRRSPALRARPALALWPASAATVLALALLVPPVPSEPVVAPVPVPVRLLDDALPAVRAAVEAASEPLPQQLRPALGRLRSDTSRLPYACLAHEEDVRSELCTVGDRSARRELLLLGDSHAFMWLPALQRIGEQDGWRVTVVMKFACTVAEVTLHNGTASDRTCTTWRRWALDQVAQRRPDLVVVTGQVPYDIRVGGRAVTAADELAGLWQAGWATTLRRLQQAADRVVLVEDPPGLPKDPLGCVGKRGTTRGDCTSAPVPHVAVLNAAAERAAAGTATPYLHVKPWFCWRDRCPTVVGATLAYRDKGHISATYAADLWPVLRRALAES
jgi:peptidoglycan/LPS O-acetylase OafA/YrhL